VAHEVRAELVASVFKVLAHEGDAVAVGDALVVLESMKMEIPVLTDAAGRVGQVCVREGDVVHEGDLLVTVIG
jgi:acetyl-CoA carboxylase biotin carboxyl carrier protein